MFKKRQHSSERVKERGGNKSTKDQQTQQTNLPLAEAGRPTEGDISSTQRKLTLETLPGKPLVIPRNEHNISRKDIDPDALKVVYRLINSGYQAFLVGGAVRDLLLGKRPKDFDIGTNATPREIRNLFRNSRTIGRRFRMIHVFFSGNKIFEVSTFRSTADTTPHPPTLSEQPDPKEEVWAEVDELKADSLETEKIITANTSWVKEDNTFGDAESDALRRDLTINGIFYDPQTFSVIDYVGGLADLEKKRISMIGDPSTRFQEDPVRMIRAIRHAARASFSIDPATYSAICANAELIKLCPTSRVFEELIKELRGGASAISMRIMAETGILAHLMPALYASLKGENGEIALTRLMEVLGKLDRVAAKGIELPVSLVLLAITIGSVSPKTLITTYPSIELHAAESLWSANLSLDHVEPLYREDDHSALKLERSRRTKPLSHEIRRMVHAIFHTLGVSRKEQEKMERMLLARYMLFWTYQKNSGIGELIRKSYFCDGLELLELTALDKDAQDCFEFWLDTLAKRKSHGRGRSQAPRYIPLENC